MKSLSALPVMLHNRSCPFPQNPVVAFAIYKQNSLKPMIKLCRAFDVLSKSSTFNECVAPLLEFHSYEPVRELISATLRLSEKACIIAPQIYFSINGCKCSFLPPDFKFGETPFPNLFKSISYVYHIRSAIRGSRAYHHDQRSGEFNGANVLYFESLPFNHLTGKETDSIIAHNMYRMVNPPVIDLTKETPLFLRLLVWTTSYKLLEWILTPVENLYGALLRRRAEYSADEFAARLTGSVEGEIRFLRRFLIYIPPFVDKFIAFLFCAHPSFTARIARLEKLAKEMQAEQELKTAKSSTG